MEDCPRTMPRLQMHTKPARQHRDSVEIGSANVGASLLSREEGEPSGPAAAFKLRLMKLGRILGFYVG